MITLPQAKKLVIAALSHDKLTIKKAIKIINYYLKRNYAAYKSHKNKTLEELQRLNN